MTENVIIDMAFNRENRSHLPDDPSIIERRNESRVCADRYQPTSGLFFCFVLCQQKTLASPFMLTHKTRERKR